MNVNGHVDTMRKDADRLSPIASTVASATRQVERAATELSRRGVAAAKARVLNAALQRAVQLCYEADTDGAPANFDRATGRILIPLPWGRKGHKRYGLTYSEHVALRYVLLRLSRGKGALFEYDDLSRGWYLNIANYHNIESARGWYERHKLDAATWRAASAKVLGK